jgi:hypothetical protein
MHFPASPNSELSDILPKPFYVSALHHIYFTHEFCCLGTTLPLWQLRHRHHPKAAPLWYSLVTCQFAGLSTVMDFIDIHCHNMKAFMDDILPKYFFAS